MEKYRRKRVILTGATGVIGTALVQELLRHEIQVTAICRPQSARIPYLPEHPNLQIVECDLEHLTELPDRLTGTYDVFYHFGWDGTFGNTRNNMSGQLANIRYTLDAVEIAAAFGCRKFIGAGSQAEYGRVEGKLSAAVPAFPENGYGIAKLCAGQMSRILCEQKGMEHIWTRILSVYGAHDGENTMIMSTICALLDGKIPVLTKGEQQWDYLYAADAARAMYLLGEKGKSGKIYCIGSGTARRLSEYMECLRDAVDPELALGIGQKPYAENQVMYLCADISELTEDTGFVPEYTFERGIRETIEWCKEKRKHEESKCTDSLL